MTIRRFGFSTVRHAPAAVPVDAIAAAIFLLLANTGSADANQIAAQSDSWENLTARVKALEEKVTTKTGLSAGPSLNGSDFEFRMKGRLESDLGLTDNDKTRVGDGSEIRRLRLAVEGWLYQDWIYRWEIELAGQAIVFKDAYLGYRGLKPFIFRVGQQQETIALDQLTSDLYATFAERSLYAQSFTEILETALGAATTATFRLADHSYVHGELGAFQNPSATGGTTDKDAGIEIGTRFVGTYFYNGNATDLIHLGGSYGRRHLGSVDRGVTFSQFRARPGGHYSATRLIDTGTLANIDNLDRYGAELAGVWGPFALQAEYLGARVERHLASQGDPTFTGYYAYLSWFPSGQSKAYDKDGARWVRIKDAFNAVELAIRFDRLNLNDEFTGNKAASSIRGGYERNVTGAINYYVNPYVRFLFDVTGADVRIKKIAQSTTKVNESPSTYWIRAQIDF